MFIRYYISVCVRTALREHPLLELNGRNPAVLASTSGLQEALSRGEGLYSSCMLSCYGLSEFGNFFDKI